MRSSGTSALTPAAATTATASNRPSMSRGIGTGPAAWGLSVRREGRSLIFDRAEPANAQALRLLPTTAVDADAYKAAYKNGDVVFLSGDLDDKWTQSEWDRFYGVAKWLANHDFRVVLNPVALIADARAAAQDERTKVIIWSSHADRDGVLYDALKKPLPDDLLLVQAGKNFQQVIFSACSGEKVTARYKTPERVSEIYWNGETTSNDLFGFLYSDRWDPVKLGENK